MRHSTTAIVARNETWTGVSATEPYEAGWASEVVIFVRALRDTSGASAKARVQISPGGMRWVDEGTFARLGHFGNWVRIAATLPEGSEARVLVTIHAKA